jgi:hypothetical protein
MNLGSGLGTYMDRRERTHFFSQLLQPSVGYYVAKDGAWLWRFSVNQLHGDWDAPSGPAVQLAALLGVPLARLRASLPDELLSWDMASVMGRKYLLSKTTMLIPKQTRAELLPKLFRRTARMQSVKDDAHKQEDGPAAGVLSERDEVLEDFVGTAIALAFVQMAALMPTAQLGERQSAAKAHFAGVLTPAGWDFEKTMTDFVTLLSPGIISSTHRWLQNARLWRLIIAQRTEGYWDASTTTAFVLEARPVSETANLPPTPWSRVSALLGVAIRAAADMSDGDLGDPGDDIAGKHDESWDEELMMSADGAIEEKAATQDPAAGRSSLARASLRRLESARISMTVHDCPLTFHPRDILSAMPRRLAHLRETDPYINVTRVWTTMCCIAFLERLRNSFIWGDGDLYPEEARAAGRSRACGIAQG